MTIIYIIFNVILFGIIVYIIYSHNKWKTKNNNAPIAITPISSSVPRRGLQVNILKEGKGKCFLLRWGFGKLFLDGKPE